jgi:hypothetical protein
MNWRHLLFLPLAALSVGTSANAPTLKAEIPPQVQSDCPYQPALEHFLFAYGYKLENPAMSAALCESARKEIAQCGEEAELLKKRIAELCQI